MSAVSKIQWTDSTGGPWMICTEVSPGCANCYARELMQARLFPIIRKAYKAAGFEDWETRPVWGDKAPRVKSKGFWTEVFALDRKAKADGVRRKVFPSMIDWLDDMPAGVIDQNGNWLVSHEIRAEFFDVIRRTPNLDWLLLTKRVEEWGKHIMFTGAATDITGKNPELSAWLMDWVQGKAPSNVWIGCTVEDKARKTRIDEIRKIPAGVRFLSIEPQLEDIGELNLEGIHWCIIGGESGPKARPFNIEWARSTVAQCKAAGVACFVKQLGADPFKENWPKQEREFSNFGRVERFNFKDKKGGDMAEWPEDLRVRQFPEIKS